MKFAAVVLLACVAVSSAAFTGSLVQRTKPSVDKAMFQLRLVAGGNKGQIQDIVGQIVENVHQQINSIIETAGHLTDVAQNLAQQTQAQIANAANAFATLGQQVGNSASSIILNLIQGLQSTFGLTGKNQNLLAILAQVQTVIDHLVDEALNVIQTVDIHQLLQNAVNTVLQHLPPQVAALINAQLNLSQKNLFGTLGELWNSVVSTVTGAASNVAQLVGNAITHIQNSGAAAISNLQAQLAHAVTTGTNVLAGASQEVISAIQDQIDQFADVFGDQYGLFVQQVNEAAAALANN